MAQKFFAVCIKDRAAETFGLPYFVPTEALAVRSFTNEVNRVADDNPLYKNPSDFELYVVGSFDDQLALLVAEAGVTGPRPRLLSRGEEVKRAS